MPSMDLRRLGFPMPRQKPELLDPFSPMKHPGWLPRREGLVPRVRREDNSLFSMWRPEAPESQRGTDIFIGGFLDDVDTPVSGAMREYAGIYARETGRNVRYFPNARVGAVVDAIRIANTSGGPVNILGHSYGGPDAYNASVRAKREGLRVDNLVTLDPVTAFFAKPQKGRPVDTWTNVKAAPDMADGSDWLTRVPPFSENPSRLPTGSADYRSVVGFHHGDVEMMMRQSGARDALDASRRSKVDILSDRQPIQAWMKIRTAGARR